MLRGAAFDQRETEPLQVSPDRTDFEIIEIRERAKVDNCARDLTNREPTILPLRNWRASKKTFREIWIWIRLMKRIPYRRDDKLHIRCSIYQKNE